MMGAGNTSLLTTLSGSGTNSGTFVSIGGKNEVLGFGSVALYIKNVIGASVVTSVVAYPDYDNAKSLTIILESGSTVIGSGQSAYYYLTDPYHSIELLARSQGIGSGLVLATLSEKRRQ
jgi:hypothetical protein